MLHLPCIIHTKQNAANNGHRHGSTCIYTFWDSSPITLKRANKAFSDRVPTPGYWKMNFYATLMLLSFVTVLASDRRTPRNSKVFRAKLVPVEQANKPNSICIVGGGSIPSPRRRNCFSRNSKSDTDKTLEHPTRPDKKLVSYFDEFTTAEPESNLVVKVFASPYFPLLAVFVVTIFAFLKFMNAVNTLVTWPPAC